MEEGETPYYRQFRVIDGDSSVPTSDEEGFAAAIEAHGAGLKLGRHMGQGFYAILWYPGVSMNGVDTRLLDKEPHVMIEFKGKLYRTLGDWIRPLLARYDIARHYPSVGAFVRGRVGEMRSGFDAERAQQAKRIAETVEKAGDRARTEEKWRRTIVAGR